MASKQMLAVLAVFAATVLPSAMGTDFVVGEDKGWTPDHYNYTEWAKGKEFRVGDHLVFNYKAGAHNVIPVGGDEFKACKANSEANAYTTGNDKIPLKKVGKKWYLCGFGNHCESGQKLVINVLPALSGAPALPPLPPPPPPASSATGDRSYAYLMLLVAAAAMMIVVA